MNEVTVNNSIARFGVQLEKGAEHIAQACKIYSDAILEDHLIAYEFEKAYPYITSSTWDKMRLAGCGSIEPKILLLSDRMGQKLIRLPLDEQHKIICEDIEIIKPNKPPVKKKLRKMAPAEIKQVFTSSMKVRTPEQQKQVIKKAKHGTAKAVPYYVEGKTLNVKRACILSLQELKLIVAKMS